MQDTTEFDLKMNEDAQETEAKSAAELGRIYVEPIRIAADVVAGPLDSALEAQTGGIIEELKFAKDCFDFVRDEYDDLLGKDHGWQNDLHLLDPGQRLDTTSDNHTDQDIHSSAGDLHEEVQEGGDEGRDED
jgi:hypothetical protein